METAENRGRAEGKAEGIVEGEAKGKADILCQFLGVRFGAESQALQETVRAITDLEVLNRITNQIFLVAQLEEASALIQSSLRSE